MEIGRVFTVRPVAVVLLAATRVGCTGAAAPAFPVGEVEPVVVVLLATTRTGCTGAAAPAFLVSEALGEALLAIACAGGTGATAPVIDVVEGMLLAATYVEDTGAAASGDKPPGSRVPAATALDPMGKEESSSSLKNSSVVDISEKGNKVSSNTTCRETMIRLEWRSRHRYPL
jgi:hypothetical protein